MASFDLAYLKKKKRFIVCSLCVYLSACLSVDASDHRRQQEVSDPLELELEVVVSFLTWVLRIELKSSIRAASALNHRLLLQPRRCQIVSLKLSSHVKFHNHFLCELFLVSLPDILPWRCQGIFFF